LLKLDVEGKMILKWMLKKWDVSVELSGSE
jgi:hypothetical protein